MVQKYNDIIAQAKRELADFVIDGLRQLQEQRYDGIIRFTYCLGKDLLEMRKEPVLRMGE